MYIVLTRWVSTSSSGQNDFPDLSHPHLPFNLLLSNSASYISPHPLSTTTAPSNSATRAHLPTPPTFYSAGGPARRQHTRLQSVIYSFSPLLFPFQSHIHSWNQGAVHADEHGLGFFFFIMEKSEAKGWKRWKRSKSLWPRKATVTRRIHPVLR